MTPDRDPHLVTLEQAELIARLRWFIQLRWVFGGMLIALGIVFSLTPIGDLNAWVGIGTGVAIIAYNWVFWFLERWLVRRRPGAHARNATLAATSQIVLDLVALTVVLHAAGGVETPLYIFYLFHMVVATLLLRMRRVFALASLAIALFGALAVAEMNAWIPHHGLFDGLTEYQSARYVGVTLLAFSSAVLIAVYLGTNIADRLREREREVLWLETELAQNVADLEKANSALMEAEKANMSHFRQVSHELKGPLATQQSLLRALLIEVKDFPAQQKQRVERAIVRGDELLALLDDLLVLSQTRETNVRTSPKWVDPSETLRDMLDAEALRAREKGLKWREEITTDLSPFCTDPAMLRTLAQNVVSNAVKYTAPGGDVTFCLRDDGNDLLMVVRDTGIGISPEDLQRIGQEFYRTREARESSSSGTGLGMTIVRSIVDTFQGGVDLSSRPGQGTTVTIRLPRTGHACATTSPELKAQ